MLKYLDLAIYWLIVLIPFSMAISPAPANVFMGLLIGLFIIKKILIKESIFPKTALNLPLLLLFIISCVSIFNSINLPDSLRGGVLRFLQFSFIFLIVAAEIKDRKHIDKIVASLILGLTLISVDEIWQVFSGHDFIRGYEPIINLGMVRATASFKDANTLGIYVSAIAPLILGLAIYHSKWKKKAVFIFLSILALAAVALTYSRPTLLAVYVALFFLAIAGKKKVLIAFLAVFTLLSPFMLPKAVKTVAKDVNYNPIRFMCNDDRIAIYRNSLNMIKAHPYIGVGVNTYMKNYKQYKEFPEYRNVVTSDFLYAHNNFLHMAAEIGLIGLAIFVWLLFKLFREAPSVYRHLQSDYLKAIYLSLMACLIAFLVNGLTESSLYSSRVAPIFWYLAGLFLSLKSFSNSKRNYYADKP